MKYSICISIAVVLIVVIGCGKGKDNVEGVNIVTTVGMIADAAAEIGGERVNVKALMGPGVDPHLYKASAGDVRRLQEADLILFIGLHLEAKMGEILGQMTGIAQAVADDLPDSDLIGNENFGGTYDPHVWFDVKIWIKVVQVIAEAIISVDPAGANIYRANMERYLEDLEELNREVQKILFDVEKDQRVLITAHDAFGYFGRAYDFQVRGLQGISTMSEAGTKDVRELADFIAENKIPALFVESSVPRKSIEALQAAVQNRGFDVNIGGELFSDAMGQEGTSEGHYIGMVRHNVETIAAALRNK